MRVVELVRSLSFNIRELAQVPPKGLLKCGPHAARGERRGREDKASVATATLESIKLETGVALLINRKRRKNKAYDEHLFESIISKI